MLNALLGYIQEARAEKSVRALMALAAPEATVVRDGERRRVATHDIVPGDIVMIEAGDKIPADARIIESANLRTDEAPLTGESTPVAKETQAIDADVGLGDRRNMLFASTVATYGRGRAVVVGTGMATEVGRIAGLLEATEVEPTPLQQELDRTGKRLSIIMLGICAIVFATGLLGASTFSLDVILGLFLFAVALAVAAIPEALPAIVTVGLSIGVRRMAATNAIVRKLPAVETLGAATVICSDKTGTLTRNEMTIRAIFTAGTLVEVGGSGYIPEGDFTVDGVKLAEASPQRDAVARTLRAARSPTTRRLPRAAASGRCRAIRPRGQWSLRHASSAYRPTSSRAFPVSRRFRSRRSASATSPFMSISTSPTNSVSSSKARQRSWSRSAGRYGKTAKWPSSTRIAGRRWYGATRPWRARRCGPWPSPRAPCRRPPSVSTPKPSPSARLRSSLPDSIEDDLTLLGLVGMIDPPRPEAKAAVAVAHRAHIRTVMITGDHPATARAIAEELGIFEPGARLVTGADLRTMGDAELDEIVEQVRVFARVDPEHKLRIVGALQRKDHIVAMTGDGINDAPALKAANIGVAMGITGTDVSKEAADMVLTDDNFASIVKAIEEGRGIYDNIRKYLIYLLSSNAGELLTMFAGIMLASILGLASADAALFLPLLAAQLLWINLITDGPPALALGIDPKDPDVMQRQPRPRGTGVLTTYDWWRLAGIGSVMMLGTLAVLDAYYPGGLFTLYASGTTPNAADETQARTMAFTTLMMFQLFNVFNCRSAWRSAFSGLFENRWLLAAVAASLFAHVLVIYVPFLQAAFHTVALSSSDWLVATAVAAILLLATELAKLVLRMNQRRTSCLSSQ